MKANARHGQAEILRFPDPSSLARAAAREWLARLSPTTVVPHTVALSGGRIARQLFQAVAASAREQHSAFSNVEFFWSDERCVPPGDTESNFRLAQDNLLKPLRVPESRTHRIRGELAPRVAAETAGAELLSLLPRAGPHRQPILDLVLLGMGEDGHVASLFPEESRDFEGDPRFFRAVRAVKPPPDRVTMGYQTIAAAREVWVLASGAGKEPALRRSLQGAAATPLGRLLNLRQRTLIYTDILG